MMKYRAAVIGLGHVGFQFGLDSKRKGTWSHVGAYEACHRTELAAAVEIDNEKISTFKEHYKGIPVYKTIRELMDGEILDIVSICTPSGSHGSVIEELNLYPLKGVFCEKPLAESLARAGKILKLAEKNGFVMAVNHTRRWDSRYLFAKNMIEGGRIGRIRAVSAMYSGQIMNIGTHLIDTVRMLTDRNVRRVSGVSSNATEPDPDIAGWAELDGNIPFTLIATGKREDLIFEIDITGDQGRIKVLENGEKIEWYRFDESCRYGGYRELSPMSLEPIDVKDRFLEAVLDIVEVIEGKKEKVNCSGEDGFDALVFCLAMIESARKGGAPIDIGDYLRAS